MNLFELSAKISVDDSDFKKSMENAQKVSKNVAKAMQELQSPLDKVKSGFNAIAHPIETAKKGFETLKNKTEEIRHPIETFKAKVQESSTALETQRNKLSVLASGYDSAKKKVDELTKEFNASAKESGTSSKKTQELAEKLKEAESKAANAKKEMDDFAKSVSEAGKNSGSAKDKIAGLVGGLGKVAHGLGTAVATAAKVGAAAVGAAATGIAALTKSSIDSYAEYEQLVGGVETLFKNSAGIVQEYAANAYKTAGLSANEYMETVTSFSASLLQSLDGDTNAAAEKANLAITDMSDNANKMGTSMEMIQNAYQGFAKQNYTMLDNLKLGYGGTKEEMQRLLKDAEKLSGQKFDLSSYADIVDAIHVVQTEMGITGTTAKEAATTISGSVSSMKSAWSNLVTGLADDEADFGTLMDNFVGSVKTAAENIAPRIGVALNGVAKLIKEIVPVAMQYIPQIITEFLPKIAESAVGIVSSITNAILENLEQILDMGIDIVEYIKNGIIENMPTIVESASEIVNTLSEKIIELSGVLAEAAYELVDALGNELSEQIPELSVVFENLETVVISLTAAMVAYKTASAISGVINTLRKATEGQTIAQTLLNAVMNANPFVLVATLVAGLTTAIISLWNTNEGFRNAVISAWESIKSAAETIFTAIANFFTETIPSAFQTMINIISERISAFIDIGKNVVENIKSGISKAWNGLVGWFNGIWDSLFGKRSVNVNVNKTTSGVNGSHAGGLSYVPFDGYIAELHKGERVLTANEAKDYRNGEKSNGGGVTVVQNIYSQAKTAADLMLEARHQQERAVLLGV